MCCKGKTTSLFSTANNISGQLCLTVQTKYQNKELEVSAVLRSDSDMIAGAVPLLMILLGAFQKWLSMLIC